MLSSWRRCKHMNRRNRQSSRLSSTTTTTTTSSTSEVTSTTPEELTIPKDFLCPISLDLMKDPVTLPTGITYDRENIETWIIDQNHTTCPVTNQPLTITTEPVPNHAIRRMIQDWCVENRNHGVERISTPRAPLTSLEATDLLARVSTSSSAERVTGLVVKVKEHVRESDRNKRLITSRGGTRILAASFESLAAAGGENVVSVLEEMLACLVLMGRIDDMAKIHLGSDVAMKRIVSLMGKGGGDLSTKRNAVLILKQVVTRENSKSIVEFDGGLDALVKLVKEPICPVSLKASLVILHRLILSSSDSVLCKVLELDIVTELLEIAIGSDKSLCEKALGVIDTLCDERKGRDSLRENALAVPVVVKKMLRVSGVATEFAVSILWKLAVMEVEDDGYGVLLDDAVQVGAFQKLLLVLQVGLGGSEDSGVTKGRVTQLLKMLNGVRRGRFDHCVESWDLKGVKRSF